MLSCLWTDDQPTCDIKKGYVFDYAVSDTITLGIPRVTKDKIGKYTCQIKNMKVEDMEFCELSGRQPFCFVIEISAHISRQI